MRARSTNILDSTYITPVVQASLRSAPESTLDPDGGHLQWPCAPGQSAVPSHMEQRSRHRTAKAAMSYSCKHVPMHDRLSTHRTREDPRGIRETARAQAAPRESRCHDTGASNTSMRTAPNKRAHMAALSYCSPSLHADLAQNVRQKRAPSCCGRPSAVASPHCRSSRRWTP